MWTINGDLRFTRRGRIHIVVDEHSEPIFNTRRIWEAIAFAMEHEQNCIAIVDGDKPDRDPIVLWLERFSKADLEAGRYDAPFTPDPKASNAAE